MATYSPIRQLDIHQDTIKLTQADIQSGSTNPIELIPAPGAGKIITILSATHYLDYNGVAYVGGDTAYITFVNTTATEDTLTSSATAYEETFDRLVPYLNRVDGKQPVNTPVYIQSATDPTGAGGTITVDITYIITDI